LETLRSAFSAKLEKLIAKFEADRGHYLSKAYPEAQARVDFITPFFKALGWDVENEAGLPHHQREVVVEKGEAETEGRPDYSFRLAGQTKFFVEAKAPSELDRVERAIGSTDAEIDELVYELYGITDEERKIIEET
jgi:predicted type IV restriction endonuclease